MRRHSPTIGDATSQTPEEEANAKKEKKKKKKKKKEEKKKNKETQAQVRQLGKAQDEEAFHTMGEGISKMGHKFGHHEHVQTAGQFLDAKRFRDAVAFDPVSDRMITIPRSATAGEALRILSGKATVAGNSIIEGEGKPILSAPVVSKKYGTDLGLVDVLDLNRHMCKFSVFLRTGDMEHFVSSFFGAPVTDIIGLDPSDQVLPFTLDAPLSEVAEGMFRVGTHRVVGVEDTHDSASPIVSVLTQTRLMAFLSDNLKLFEPKPETPLSELRFGDSHSRKLHTITVGEPALHAFEKIQAMNVSAVAVVDESGKLVNSVSASNVRLLNPSNVHLLLKPVETFLKELEIKQSDACHLSTTLEGAIQTIRKFHLHRIWVVDDQQKLLSVVTVSDVLRRFYDNAELSRAAGSEGHVHAKDAKEWIKEVKEVVNEK